MKIRTKLALFALVPVLGTAVLAGLGYWQLGEMKTTNQDLVHGAFTGLVDEQMVKLDGAHKSISLLLNGDRDAYQALQAEMTLLAGVPSGQRSGVLEQSSSNSDQVISRVSEGARNLPPESAQLAGQFDGQFKKWQGLHQQILKATAGDPEQAQQLAPESLAAFEEMRHTIDLMQEAQEQSIASILEAIAEDKLNVALATAEAERGASRAMTGFLVIGFLVAAFAIVGVVLLARGLLTPIKALVASFRLIAEGGGDLSQRVDDHRHDELGDLGKAFNKFLGKLETMVFDVSQRSGSINSSSHELSSTSQELARSAMAQAEHIGSIQSSTKEVSDMAASNSHAASEASDLSEHALTAVERSQEQMNKLIEAMAMVGESSGHIKKISQLIDDIAFQTNLLALNAAVEAARAGDQGKGFAVVAEEVRSLALRSAEAARQANERIEESVVRTAAGSEIANQVGAVLGEIADGTAKTNGLLREIADSSHDQTARIGNVNGAVGELESLTQRNAGGAEELAASAEEASAQASMLDEQVSMFQISHDVATRRSADVPLDAFDADESLPMV